MSLDVYLNLPGRIGPAQEPRPRIFVREEGKTREISREEWDRRYPGREPVTLTSATPPERVYQDNITHNLNTMADEAGLYDALWRPEALGITKASQLLGYLRSGLQLLREEPERFRAFNPGNGWGTYEGLVAFVANYLTACEQYPEAEVSVSR